MSDTHNPGSPDGAHADSAVRFERDDITRLSGPDIVNREFAVLRGNKTLPIGRPRDASEAGRRSIDHRFHRDRLFRGRQLQRENERQQNRASCAKSDHKL